VLKSLELSRTVYQCRLQEDRWADYWLHEAIAVPFASRLPRCLSKSLGLIFAPDQVSLVGIPAQGCEPLETRVCCSREGWASRALNLGAEIREMAGTGDRERSILFDRFRPSADAKTLQVRFEPLALRPLVGPLSHVPCSLCVRGSLANGGSPI
jgi:hypothetical protein